MRTRFSTNEVAGLTGATVRQIDHWARTGLVKPSEQDAKGRGSRRRYGFRDVVAVQTIQQLRGNLCPLQKIRKAVRYLRTHYPAESNAAMLSRLTLLTDGDKVYMLSDERQIMEVVTRQTVWAIPLGKLISDTQAKIEKIPTSWEERVQVNGKTYHLDVIQDEESAEYSAQCRELPGAIEQGRTMMEAVSNGRDAIVSVLDYLSRRNTRRHGGTSTRVQAQ